MAQDNFPKSRYPAIKGIGTLVKEGEIAFVRINFAEFRKSADEKNKVKVATLNHNRQLRKLGIDPKKQMNHKDIPI